MSESYKVILEEHKRKIEGFISRYEYLIAENMRLKEKLALAEAKVEEGELKIQTYNQKIEELEQQIERLQLTEAFKYSASDVKEAKKNISRLVKEIEKCIALLNE